MIGRGLFVLTVLSSCVLSLPLTPSQLENEDVKVMKCIVEALADVLSRPHPVPVSQECLVTLRTDDRLVSILRHHNFLRELQEIAVQGGQERAQLQRDAGMPDSTTQTPQTAGDIADRSMLEALGGPGERSILSQKRRTGNGGKEEEKHESLEHEESQEDPDTAEEMQVKRENDIKEESHGSETVDESNEGRAEKRDEEGGEYEKKKANSKENSEENMTKDKKDAGSEEKRDAPRNQSKQKKKFDEEDEDAKDKRSALFSHRQEEKQEEEEDEGESRENGSRDSLKRWTKRGKALPLKRKAVEKEAQQQLNNQQEVPHHSKEVSEEEEEDKKSVDVQRSPEEKELQMIARKGPEEKRVLEEEGSASRKSEEPEIESLAAIESELENVAQKLHELRRG